MKPKTVFMTAILSVSLLLAVTPVQGKIFRIVPTPTPAGSNIDTFGNWDTLFVGDRRDRGDRFSISTKTTLEKIEYYLDISSSAKLYFFVYESATENGAYSRIHQTYLPASGSGMGWYSSGAIDVVLEAGKYYYIGASWEALAAYSRGSDIVPIAASFGQLINGVSGPAAGYPPKTTITSFPYLSSHPYYMRLTSREYVTTPTPTPSVTPTPSPTPTPTPLTLPVPFSEDFEGVWSGGAPELWSKEYITGTHDWVRSSGGQDGHPSSAHGGTYNALFFRDDFTMPVTRLITPRLDFGTKTNNARLTFWHAMEKYWDDQDELAVYYRTSVSSPWTLLAAYNTSVPAWTERSIPLPDPGCGYYICFEGTAKWGYGVCIDNVLITGESTDTSLPIIDSGDYNGDGTSDIAIFRGSSGMWSVRGVTRVYYGSNSDIPIPGDYNGDGATDIGIFRPGSGLWGVRGVTRVYYGSSSDVPVPGDYDGDGSCDVGIFRSSSGLWAVTGVTRTYFGGSSDLPVPGDYNGDGRKEIAVFRPGSGMWAIQGLPRVYFGSSSDTVVPGDYNGDGTWEAAIFRPSSGMWAVTGVTRAYYGSASDQPVPADYNGDSIDDMGIFRNSSGLWGIRNISRAYFGGLGDIPVTR